jgi:hypothetical protein
VDCSSACSKTKDLLSEMEAVMVARADAGNWKTRETTVCQAYEAPATHVQTCRLFKEFQHIWKEELYLESVHDYFLSGILDMPESVISS